MLPEKRILSEFQKAIQQQSGKEIIDLDDRFRFDFNFFLEKFENIFPKKIKRVPPNKWSYYRIGLITRGTVEFVAASCRINAKKNYLIAMAPRLITSSKEWSDDIKGYLLLFDGDFFVRNGLPASMIKNKDFFFTAVRPYVELTDEETAELETLFDELIKENAEHPGDINELLSIKTYELVLKTERLFNAIPRTKHATRTTELIRKFIDELEENFTRDRSVKFYADKLSVHENYLNTIVKKHTGLTAKESIQNRLMLEVKYLLHSTSLSIKEISAMLSFNDPNYLTTLFKKSEKISPAQYRLQFV